MPLRVVLGEDSLIAREGIVRMLETMDVDLVGVCDGLDLLRSTIDRELPDVVLTDIRMPPTHTDEGIRLAEELRSSHPEIGVVVLSQHAEPVYATTLFGRGAERRAYLLKDRLHDRQELDRALQTVSEGGSFVDSRIVDELIAAKTRRDESPVAQLTPRELEILGMIAEGMSNAAIARRLVITRRAVERHINSIFKTLELTESEEVSRRVVAVLLYLQG